VEKMENALLYATRINMKILQMKPAQLAIHFAEDAMFQNSLLLILKVLILAVIAPELLAFRLYSAHLPVTALANQGSILTRQLLNARLVTPDALNALALCTPSV
jgi:hypothetical protein